MLLFSPTQPWRVETRLSTGFVLSSRESSTRTRPPHHSAARTDVVPLIRRTVRPRGYASGSCSPAALPDGHFEHSAGVCLNQPARIVRSHLAACGKEKFGIALPSFPAIHPL
jgi:hypothetical protein